MGLSLEQKQAMVSEVADKLKGAQAVIVAEYRGLNVERVTQLRSKARKSGLYLRVLKNTLARRAVKGTPFEKLSEQMVGPLMYGIAQDPVAGAKVIAEFAKENEQFVIKAGAMPRDGSSRTKSLGLAINARPIASICCSPPERVPATCGRRSLSLGKSLKIFSNSSSYENFSRRT